MPSKPKSVKVGDIYRTSKSGLRGTVLDIHQVNGRKVVEMTVNDDVIFSTLPRGIRAKATV
jgi:hypothetical protein